MSESKESTLDQESSLELPEDNDDSAQEEDGEGKSVENRVSNESADILQQFVTGNIENFYHGHSGKGSGNIADPTMAFSDLPPSFHFKEAELRKWTAHLKEHRLITVWSTIDTISTAAIRALVRVPCLKDYERRSLSFNAETHSRFPELGIQALIESVGNDKGPKILVVGPGSNDYFFSSAFVNEQHAADISRLLETKDLIILFRLSRSQREKLRLRASKPYFPSWDIDFLSVLLFENHEEDFCDFYRDISDLRTQACWGGLDDQSLYDELIQVAGDAKRLKTWIKGKRVEIERLTVVSVVEVFKKRVPVYQAVLVCAALFRGLDVSEFAQVIFSIVGDEKVYLQEPKLLSGRTTLEEKEASLRDAWPKVADEIFESCGLVIQRADGETNVNFSSFEQLDSFLAYIRSSVYLSTMGETLWQVGHLFEPGASQERVDGVIRVFTEALPHHKEWQRSDWLVETLISHLSDGGSRDLATLLQDVVKDLLVLRRTSQLLRVLVERGEYPDLVPSWLAYLLAHRGHRLALQLAMNLRYTEGFDYLFWLKRFIDESPDDVRNDAYMALYQHVRQSTVQIWEIIGELENWLPEDAIFDLPTVSTSGRFAFQVILEICLDTAEAIPPEKWGDWPSTYAIFRNSASSKESIQNNLLRLVGWLLSPSMGSVFLTNPEILVWLVRARLLELWSLILFGLEENRAHPDAVAIYEQLLELFCRESNREARGLLLSGWRSYREHLKTKRRKGDHAQVKHLSKCISASLRLEKDFKQLCKENGRRARRSGKLTRRTQDV